MSNPIQSFTRSKLSAPLIVGLLWSFAYTEAYAQIFSLSTQPSSIIKSNRMRRGHESLQISIALNQLELIDAKPEDVKLGDSKLMNLEFQDIKIDQLSTSSKPGTPALPFYSAVFTGSPADIEIQITKAGFKSLKSKMIIPSQKQKCRCETNSLSKLEFNKDLYQGEKNTYRIESLGDYQGRPVSRILIFPASYNQAKSTLEIYSKLEISIRSKSHAPLSWTTHAQGTLSRANQDFLIISKAKFIPSLIPWMTWKEQNQSIHFREILVDGIDQDSAKITEKIQEEYGRAPFQYAMIVGSQAEITPHFVYTESDSQTPSDLPYFAMGGTEDIIPDAYTSRLIANSESDVSNQIKKWLQYEQSANTTPTPIIKGIGVASNQGANPSDEDYVKSIESKFKEIENIDFTHLGQNDVNSNPTTFNQLLEQGASWITYVGHGSGTSWPSFHQSYSTYDIKNLSNSAQAKPIWIDVACQNGGFIHGRAGERLMNEVDVLGNPIGAVAFYGGTVNISWDPPAIMARGIAFKMLELKPSERILGNMLQLGQLYLSENFSDLNAITYNQRWYHLQGDPSMVVKLK